ncbi:hypothetical protein [Hyalangium sp.]|uniref:hypothetical protein n=1 Tax=Hyalangium sp. TaxID=2028555 RepID=UPI002D3FD4EB|nr:hypothetical protein [Hyalangium sp.]HYH96305.1 hypothetical protein [Hyalangium sp.]
MSFADALVENRIPPRVGDVRLRYDEGRMLGESLPPSVGQRLVPELCLLLAATCAVGSLTLLVVSPSHYGAPVALGVGAAVLIGYALRREARLGRRRFVLHFATETLRMERLTWAPSATRTETVPFDDVTAVEVVQRPSGHYAILVSYTSGPKERREARRQVLVEQIRPSEAETLHRVWRMLHNAFGLKASEPSGG